MEVESVRVMVFNATFNNISVILWQSVLLVEETGVPGESHQPATSTCDRKPNTTVVGSCPYIHLTCFRHLHMARDFTD
jgi:hypothetical protein